jgi:hypothetical protein
MTQYEITDNFLDICNTAIDKIDEIDFDGHSDTPEEKRVSQESRIHKLSCNGCVTLDKTIGFQTKQSSDIKRRMVKY